MDNVTLVSIVMFAGALMGTLVPYWLKAWQDPNISFDLNYGYALALNVIVQVVALMPDNVPVMSFKVIATAFATGYGLQSIMSKFVPKPT